MSNPNIPAENKMGVAPVNKLLLTMALPIVGSMLVQALYNVVDSVFVSQFNEDALSAVSIAFSVQTIIMAIGIGTNTGVNALLSRSLGEKNIDRINRITQHALFLTLACTVVVTAASFFFIKPFMRLMTTPETTQIYQYGVDYLNIICWFSFFSFAVITLERLLSATGKTHLMTVSQIVGAVINIILDPLMIFGYGPFPVMGVTGAAAATMIAQAVGVLIALYMNLKKNTELNLSMKGFRPDGALIKEIYKIGIPSGMIMLLNSLTTMLMNRLLISFTVTAVAVLGVYFKLNSFVFFPIFSLNQAGVAIVAYNLGARRKKRIDDTIRYTLIYGVSFMLIGTLVFLLLPAQLLSLFSASENMLAIGVPALRIICTIFPFAAMCIILGSVMQAVGHAIYTMLTTLFRQVIILVPVAYLFSLIGGLDLIWWAYLISEGASLLFTLIFFRRVYRNVIRPLPE